MNKFEEMLITVLAKRNNVEWNDINIKKYTHTSEGVQIHYEIWYEQSKNWGPDIAWIWISELIEQQFNNK